MLLQNWQKWLGVFKMIRFYVNMVRQGRIMIENIPEKWREDVIAALINDNPDYHVDSEIVQKANAYDVIVRGVVDDTD